MQATTRFHDGITNPIFEEAYRLFDNPIAVHSTNGGLNADSNRRDATMDRLFRWGEFTATGVFLGLDHADAGQHASLAAPILIEATSGGERIALQLRQALIMHVPFIGVT